jgi:hypothetical protein
MSPQVEFEKYVTTYKSEIWNTFLIRIRSLAEKGTLVDYSSATGYRAGVFYLNQQMKTTE